MKCNKTKAKQAEYTKKWRAKNRDKIKAKRAQYYAENKEKLLKQMKARRIQVKLNTIRAYSPNMTCRICGTSFIEFLAIDHINGGGRQHCRELGNHGSHRFYLWLQKNEYPGGYRVLCHNCNLKHGKKDQPKRGFKPISEYSDKTAALVRWLIANPENHAKYNERKRRKRKEQRQQVISHYGGICTCCGLDDLDVLSIDHINGGGNRHRRIIGDSSYQMYKWIIKNNYPEDFQVLCMNCNLAKAHGVCPHESQNQSLS